MMTHRRLSTGIIVPPADEYADILLDEWDTAIAAYEQAIRDAAAARCELAALREPMAIIEAETVLGVEGRADAERRARALLTLRRHEGWRGYRRASQAAHERLHDAEGRATVARMRAELVRAALAAVLHREHPEA